MRTTSRIVRGALAATSAGALIVAGFGSIPTASAATGTTLRVAVTKHGLYLNGPTTFPAGRVKLVVDAAGKSRSVEVIRLHAGYSFHDFRSDIRTVGENLFAPGGNRKKGLKTLNYVISHITGKGGLGAPQNQVRHGWLLLKDPGSYVLFDDSGNLPRRPVQLTVTAPEGPQVLPATTARVVALTTRRFKGSTVLPAHGDVLFKNKSTESPHFLVLQHVKEGTTRKQIIDSFTQNAGPDFVLPGEQDTDFLSTNEKMVIHLRLPPGEYAEMCFFPDPKTGMPHAFMGMVRIVHVR